MRELELLKYTSKQRNNKNVFVINENVIVPIFHTSKDRRSYSLYLTCLLTFLPFLTNLHTNYKIEASIA